MSTNNNPLADRRIWVRVLYMVLMWFAFSIAELLLAIVAIFQAVVAAFNGKTNDAMHRFGKNLSTYIASITEYLSFNTDELPFPFNDWPQAEPTPTAWTEAPDTAEAPEQAAAEPQTASVDATEDSAEPAAEPTASEAQTPAADAHPADEPPKSV